MGGGGSDDSLAWAIEFTFHIGHADKPFRHVTRVPRSSIFHFWKDFCCFCVATE